MRAKLPTRPARTFWWDRELPTEADVLRAVIFDADSALAHIDRDCDVAARTALIDSVMSLFVAGIWVSVVSAGTRPQVESMVRQLLGDGLVETIVTIDDLPEPDAELARSGELFRLALWEMGITARGALAVTGQGAGVRSSATAGLPAVVVDELSAASCQQAHRRWWIRQPGDDAVKVPPSRESGEGDAQRDEVGVPPACGGEAGSSAQAPLAAQRLDDGAEVLVRVGRCELGVDVGGVAAQRRG